MEDLYSIHPGIPRSQELATVELPKEPLFYSSDAAAVGLQYSNIHKNGRQPRELSGPSSSGSDLSDLMKAKIAGHPRYPALVSAYIDCRKVGAPPEMTSLLEGIRRGEYPSTTCGEIGADPELDEFMVLIRSLLGKRTLVGGAFDAFNKLLFCQYPESYCRALVRYKEELARPFDEAASFLSRMETQLRDLCKAAAGAVTSTTAVASSAVCNSPSGTPLTRLTGKRTRTPGILLPKCSHSEFCGPEEGGGSTDEDLSCGELDALENQDGGSSMGEQELKEMLLKKYSGYLSTLRKEFMKKRKKGKLPKSARLALLDWWNAHYRWPYPTEEEKARLAEITGLDQKQINNWFINQRKRHWKPSDDMRIALMEGVASGSSSATTWYFDTRTVGP
ncbi:hypothetical protein Taro_038653 [Colocasia esculenta]|uniref:Uncharacterized protein n=1 Tax=Colocasia esculenta TaxID=4460 RepID=A0A843WGG1_COLES|nr:hypothetical protein [Colocasia esculenta]